jgi:hypothetical protein
MTRTRPGSIIMQCHNATGWYPAFVGIQRYTVHRVVRNCAFTTTGYKIRSWIVVKE